MSNEQREPSRRERAAAAREDAAATERNRRILITLAIVLVLSAIVAGGVIFTSSGGTTPKPTASAAASVSGQALVVGRKDAEHTVVVYEDFLCPYCRQFETSTRDFLRADAQKGLVQVEYRPFHLLQDDYSSRSLSAWAAVLQHGSPQQALRLHDLLYDKQPYENDPTKPDADQLAAWAKQSGVTDSAVLDATKRADAAFVQAADAAAAEAGVSGTPTVLVDGQPLGGASITDMVNQLERTLAGK
jgi:protein-disulfide isomerase